MGLDTNDTTRRNRNRSWFQQRTNMERRGIIFLTIAFVIIIALIVALVLVANKRKTRPEDEICNTPGCVDLAATLLKNMDQSVDPCDNFYDFVCGGFVRDATIPDDQTEVGIIQDISNLVEIQLRKVYEETSSKNDPRPFTLLKNFYNMCLDTASLEDMTAITELIKQLGGWPVLEGSSWDDNNKNFDWKTSSYRFRENGMNPNNFIKTELQPDFKNSSIVIINLDQPDEEISRDNLLGGLDDELVKSYYNYMIDLAVLFGADRTFAEYEVKQMVEFKIQLTNITVPDAERRDRANMYHPMTVYELQQRYPTIFWLEYLNKIINLPDVSVTNEYKVNVAAPQYFSKIGYLLDRTSKRILANHAISQALRSIVLLLPEAGRNREQQFIASYSGISTGPPRWQECVKKTTELFNIAAQALYVRKYFKKETKQSAIEMVSNIKDAFIKILKEDAKWMDKPTREKAIEKALAMPAYIGYTDELFNDRILEEYYSELHISSDNVIQSLVNVSIFNMNIELSYIRKPVNRSDWVTRLPSTDVNAGYNLQENSVHMTAAILQRIVFDKSRIHATNYGNMGFFIGHEITHGFDSEGRNYDKEGNLANWWSDEASKAYDEKKQCIIEQYSNYTVPELGQNLDGTMTQSENIADNGGIKEAYIAYNSWAERNGPEPKLPGLNYTARQLFWISAANCWCTKERPESLQSSITDVHSIARFRVLGSFSNLEFFANDFQCPVGSKMNPKHKCQVW